MHKVTFTKTAQADLFNILSYRAEYNLEHALTFLDELKNSLQNTLGTFAHSGRIYNKEKQIRQLAYKGYTAFYKVDEEEKEVIILHVLDLTKPLEVRGINFQ